jgi:hypothetical protein
MAAGCHHPAIVEHIMIAAVPGQTLSGENVTRVNR